MVGWSVAIETQASLVVAVQWNKLGGIQHSTVEDRAYTPETIDVEIPAVTGFKQPAIDFVAAQLIWFMGLLGKPLPIGQRVRGTLANASDYWTEYSLEVIKANSHNKRDDPFGGFCVHSEEQLIITCTQSS